MQNNYDNPSNLFNELDQLNVLPYHVQTLDLRTAGSVMIPAEGYYVCIFGHDGSAIKTVNTTAFVKAWINARANDGGNPFPMKHSRGFAGGFKSVYFEWPAQANVFCDVVIYKSRTRPWINGETPT